MCICTHENANLLTNCFSKYHENTFYQTQNNFYIQSLVYLLSFVSLRRLIIKFLNVCPFNCGAAVGNEKAGTGKPYQLEMTHWSHP